jgi:hypothetical protein
VTQPAYPSGGAPTFTVVITTSLKSFSIPSQGYSTIGDLWDRWKEGFKEELEIRREFDLSPQDSRRVASLTQELTNCHHFQLRTPDSAIFMHSWIGGFRDDSASTPEFLFQTNKDWDPPFLTLTKLWNPPPSIPIYVVGKRSQCLIPAEGDLCGPYGTKP